MLERTNLTRRVTAESHAVVCSVLFMVAVQCDLRVWFALVVCFSSLHVCFIYKLVVICCSVSVAECNISHILGLKVCCLQRKRNYTAQKECNVDEVYLRDKSFTALSMLT